MSESTPYSGLERLTWKENEEYIGLRKEVITLADFWEQSKQQTSEDLNLILPENRRKRLVFLLNQSRLSFVQLDIRFRRAIQTLGLGRELYPGVALPQESDTEQFEFFPRPDNVIEYDISSLEEIQGNKKQLDLLIDTVRKMRAVSAEPTSRLVTLCKDLVSTSKNFGGLEKYTQDSEFATYVSDMATIKMIPKKQVPVSPVDSFVTSLSTSPTPLEKTGENEIRRESRLSERIVQSIKQLFQRK